MAPSAEDLPRPGASVDRTAEHPTPTGHRDYNVDYRIIQEIGRGGQGIVYLAEDRVRGRKVALKVLREVGGISAEALGRLRREVDAAARLDHPGICRVHEAVLDGPSPWIAMRYVAGRSLAQEIAAAQNPGDETIVAPKGRPPETTPVPSGSRARTDRVPSGPATRAEIDRVLEVIEQAALALHAAHEAGVIHRDVKPSNIMVGTDGHPVILDFGLAHLEESDLPGLTRTGEIWGTPAYLSPEQLMPRARLDRRTDVWSLGVTLYECLTLKRPFDGPTHNQIFHAIQTREPADPSRLNRALPADLRVVLATALEKDRDRRYDSALAFAEDLRCVRERRAIAARPIGPITQFVRWSRRNPALAASLLLAFCTLTAGLVVTVGLLIARDAALRDKELALTQKTRALSEKDAALEHSEGLRLLAESSAALPRDPGLALLLAVEGAWRAPKAGSLVNGTINETLSDLREIRTLSGHLTAVENAEFSRDGERVVTVSAGGVVSIWDVGSGESLGSFDHPRAARATFASGGDRVVSIGTDGTCKIWNGAGATPQVVEDVAAHALSGDGRLLLTLTPSEARVWLADSGARVATIDIPSATLIWAGFSPDGKRVLAIDRDGGARVWDSEGGGSVARIEGAFPDVRLPRFSPDGRQVFAMSKGSGVVWNLESGRTIPLEGPIASVVSASFSPDGKWLLALTAESVVVWDARTGRSRVLCGPEPGEGSRADGPRPEASFTHDSQRVVGASCDGTGHVWKAETGEELAILSGHSGDVRFVSASPDGSIVVTSSSTGILTLWDTGTWEQLAMLRGHSAEVRHVSFSSKGDRIVTASSDRTARVWDAQVSFGAPLLEGHQGAVNEVRFSADGTLALTASTDGYPRIWDLRNARASARLVAKKGLVSPEFSPDGKRVIALSEDGTAVLFESPTGTLVATLGGATNFCNAVFDAAGTRVVTASDDGNAYVFDARDGRDLAQLVGHEGAVHFVGFCANGAHVVTASEDHTVRIWDATSGAAIAQTPGHGHLPPVVSPDGRRIAVTLVSGEIRVYDAATGREVARLPGSGHGGPVFSPDGTRIATADVDGNFRLWDIGTGSQAGVLRQEEGVRLHGFSPDGARVLTTTRDGAAQLWEIALGRRIPIAAGSGAAVTDAAFSPDGRWVIVSTADETRVFDAKSASEAWVMTRRHGSVKSLAFSPDGAWILAGYSGGLARLWPSDPLAKAVLLKPRELTLQEIAKHGTAVPEEVAGVMRLFEDTLTNEEIVATLERRENLGDALRAAAIKAATTRNPHVVAEKLRRRSWAVVSRPNADPEQYVAALKWSEVALKTAPGIEDGLTTLGAAEFRAGQFRRALATLQDAFRSALIGNRSYTRVRSSLFIAMSHSKLGEHSQAATALSDARRTLAQLGTTPPEEIRRLLEEADATIAAAPRELPSSAPGVRR